MKNSLKNPNHDAIAADRFVNKLTKRDWKATAVIRLMPGVGLFRVSISGLRYFDRGAGGFMSSGEWVFEGRVICEGYPSLPHVTDELPAILSKAGWGFSGSVPSPGEHELRLVDRAAIKPAIAALNKEFWNLDDALAYANGADGSALEATSTPVSVTHTKNGYRLHLAR